MPCLDLLGYSACPTEISIKGGLVVVSSTLYALHQYTPRIKIQKFHFLKGDFQRQTKTNGTLFMGEYAKANKIMFAWNSKKFIFRFVY